MADAQIHYNFINNAGCTILDFCRYADIFQIILADADNRYISFCLETTPSLSCAEIISKIFLILVSF